MSDGSRQASEQVPAAIGRYQITGSLGQGAMGAVYRAFDPLIQRPLAIKTIRLDVPRRSPQHRAFIERFYREARISGTLSHPGIVTLFDIGEEGGVPFLAMEFVDGRTIAEILAEGTRFKPEKVIGLVSQVAAALDYAHSRGVVHRDVKPSNLILYEGDKVKISDFGIAKLADSEITHAGVLLGTPSYMSPEQAMGDKLDGRSDIFSLGVVAFEMLSGHQPFPGPNVTSILYKLVHVEPIEPADLELSGLVPHKWREVFHKVLAKKPEQRYQTASAFVQDLEYCLGSWFAGIDGEKTLSLAAPADETTVTIPRLPAPAPVRNAGVPALAAEMETLLVASLPPAAAQRRAPDSATTLVLDAPPDPTVSFAPTAVMGPLAAASESPPEAAQTQPPEPTLHAVPPDPPSAMPARKALGSGLPLLGVLGGAAALGALLVLAGWALRQQAALAVAPAPEPTPLVAAALPVPAVLPAVTTGTLRVDSEPEGARVLVNGHGRGRTPLVLTDLPFGSYDVRVEQQGYVPERRQLGLDAGAPAGRLRLLLKRASPVSGAADFVSTPAGASVRVDGREAGDTPLRGVTLKPGRRQVEMALAGHETWAGTLDVVAGETGRVAVRLQALPAAAPTPVPVDVARVYANVPGQVDTLARKLSGASPAYPAGRVPRLRSGQRVSVLVRFVVSEAGEVVDLTVVESGGREVDDVVVAALRGWKFEPATKHGTRVKVEASFRQTFLGG